jgi:hypothetical protein
MCDAKQPERWKLDVNDRYQKAVGTIISLSTAALVSPIVFLRDAGVANERQSVLSLITGSAYWGSGLLAASVVAGILYYFFSAKWVKLACGQPTDVFWISASAKWIERLLDWTYFVLTVGFLAGVACMIKFMVTFVRSS